MRLAVKYQVDALRERIIGIMHDNWPRTFDEWLRFEAETALTTIAHADNDCLIMQPLKRCLPEPAAAVRFAQDFDVPSSLPFAFSTLAGIKDTHAWEKENVGTALRLNTRGTARFARWDVLDATDRAGLAKVRCLLTEKTLEVIHDFRERWISDQLAEAEVPCPNARHECHEGWEGVLYLWRDEVLHGVSDYTIRTTPDPLDYLEKMLASRVKWNVCDQCQQWMQGRIRDAQRDIWDLMLRQPWAFSRVFDPESD